MIVGSEKIGSKPGRPFKYLWARGVRYTCVKNDIPFFFKQAPKLIPTDEGIKGVHLRERGKIIELPDLDGETWEQFPKKYDRLSRTMMIPE